MKITTILWVGGVEGEAGSIGSVGLLHKAVGVCRPNGSLEPTGLSWCFAR